MLTYTWNGNYTLSKYGQLLTIEDVRSLSLIGIFEILRNRLNEEKKDD